jgi:hypothetical protein
MNPFDTEDGLEYAHTCSLCHEHFWDERAATVVRDYGNHECKFFRCEKCGGTHNSGRKMVMMFDMSLSQESTVSLLLCHAHAIEFYDNALVAGFSDVMLNPVRNACADGCAKCNQQDGAVLDYREKDGEKK